MRATILVLLAFLLATATAHAAPEDHPVTIDLKDAPLPDALKQIEQQSGLRLAYDQELIEKAEPVTLKVENMPAGEVLRRILRPRGLEYIQTSRTMLAIVPADSDMGMAKMAGRAIRTFARLAKKLEAAEQHGDEVKVPGWTDADDRALAEGLMDFLGA
ncbi:MAG: STN domain-containing protein, partial [Planctomycetes bacterium]|nr:STN domain-containing protein [Planctomycetota bacterium]